LPDIRIFWLSAKHVKCKVLDHIEGVGQEIGYCYRSMFIDAGFEIEVIPNQGWVQSCNASRQLGGSSRTWWNADTTEAGREPLGFYHEKKDEARNIGLGPEHDWSSHACDAFGLMAVVYEEPAG
jgi:phage terminase large subunit